MCLRRRIPFQKLFRFLLTIMQPYVWARNSLRKKFINKAIRIATKDAFIISIINFLSE